jgi:prepilin-type N-terminal cleavage/methylation domain-containing protein
MKQRNNKYKGFTLAELLIAVCVMSIILTAVAVMSFALGSANDSMDNSSEVQSRIRYATVRISELIRGSKLICSNSGGIAAIWQADNNRDNKINLSEVVYLETSVNNDCIKLASFKPSAGHADAELLLADILSGQARTWLNANAQTSSVNLVNNCNYVTFTTDEAAPFSRRLNIFFGIRQRGVIQNYQISTYLRCQASYLLDDSGQILLSDAGAAFDVPTVPIVPVPVGAIPSGWHGWGHWWGHGHWGHHSHWGHHGHW